MMENMGMQYAQMGFSFFVAVFFLFVMNKTLGRLKYKIKDVQSEIAALKDEIEETNESIGHLSDAVRDVAENQRVLTAVLQNRKGTQ